MISQSARNYLRKCGLLVDNYVKMPSINIAALGIFSVPVNESPTITVVKDGYNSPDRLRVTTE